MALTSTSVALPGERPAPRGARWAAGALLVLTLAAAVGVLVLQHANRHVDAGSALDDWPLSTLEAVALGVPAAIITLRRPRHPVGWLLAATAFLVVLSTVSIEW